MFLIFLFHTIFLPSSDRSYHTINNPFLKGNGTISIIDCFSINSDLFDPLDNMADSTTNPAAAPSNVSEEEQSQYPDPETIANATRAFDFVEIAEHDADNSTPSLSNPSFSNPYGSTQVVNLKNEPEKYVKKRANSNNDDNGNMPRTKRPRSGGLAPFVSRFSCINPRMLDKDYQSEDRWNTTINDPRYKTLQRGEIPIDPVLLAYDRQAILSRRNQSGSPTLPALPLRVS